MFETRAKKVIAFTEEWWGSTLDEDLVKRIGKAPFAHLEAFYDQWPFEQSGHPELDVLQVPTLPSGDLRPALPGRELSAVNVLLYSESIVLSSSFLSPLHSMHLRRLGHFHVAKSDVKHGAEYGFGMLAKLRPLIETDLVYFTNLTALPYQYASYSRGPVNYDLNLGDPHQTAVLNRGSELAVIEHLFLNRKVTPVALDAVDEEVFTSWRVHSTIDRSLDRIASLAKISTPDLHISVKDLVTLRTDEPLFDRWRSVLKGALDDVRTFDTSPEAAREARAVVGRELEHASRDLRAAMETSRALNRMLAGARGFAVGAFIAGGEVAFEDRDLWSKAGAILGGGTAAGAVELIRTGRKEASKAKLIDRLVVGFRS